MFDLKSIITYLTHYNKELSVMLWVSQDWCLSWYLYFAIDKGVSFMLFPSAHFNIFTNFAFPNFYKTVCTNIDLPANFLEIFGSGENLADFFQVEIINFWIVLNLVANSVYP